MKPFVSLAILACFTCLLQAGDESEPATTNVMGSQFPRINSNLSASLRLKAPDARKVGIHVGGAFARVKLV